MASPVFEMFGRLSLDKSKYDEGMDRAEKESSSFVSKLNKGLGVVAKGVAVGVTAATGAVVKLTKSVVDGFANYEQLKGGVETLFKDSASTVMKYADQAYKTAGLSANQYMETTTSFAASLLQSVGGNTKMAADIANRAVIDMADNANKMGTDMSAIQTAYMGFSKQNYTMLDNLKLGYGGTKTEMERLIADASKMKAEQEELNVTVEEGNMSFANIVNAISVMQQHLDIAGTTSREASTTIQGSTLAMKAAWDNLLVGLADDTQNIDGLISQLVESVVTMLQGNLIPRIQTILGGIGELVEKTIGVLSEQIPELLNTLLPPLLSAATTLFVALAEAIPDLLQIILEQVPMIVESIVAVIPTLTEALLELIPQLVEVGVQIILMLVQGITQSIPNLIPVMVETLNAVINTIISNLPLIIESGVQLLGALGEGIINAIPTLVAAMPKIISSIVTTLTQNFPKIVDTGVKLLTSLIKNLPSIINMIVSALPQIISAILNYFTQNVQKLVQAGVQLLTALIKALPEIINTIVGALPEIIDAIVSTLMDNIPTIIQAGVDLFVALIENLPQIIATIISAVPQIISSIVNAFASKISDMWSIGTNLVKGIFQGIQNAGQWLWSKLTGWVDDVIGWIKGLFGIHSPSAVMRDQVGRMMGEGVAEGILDSLGDVEDASNQLLGAIPDIDNRDFSVNMKRNISDTYATSYTGMASAFLEALKQYGLYAVVDGDQASEALEPLISGLQARQINRIERSGLYATV